MATRSAISFLELLCALSHPYLAQSSELICTSDYEYLRSTNNGGEKVMPCGQLFSKFSEICIANLPTFPDNTKVELV